MSPPYGSLDASEANRGSSSSETTGLLNETNEVRKYSRTTVIATATLLTLASSLIIFAAAVKSSLSSSNKDFKTFGTVSDVLVVSAVSNEYGVRSNNSMLPYGFLTDSFLIEPYKPTTITLQDTYGGCAFDWSFKHKITDTVSATGITTDGFIIATLNATGEYTFTVSEMCGNSIDSNRQLDMRVWVKYVRRELSALNDNDREEFLDAFHTLWTVSTTKGQTLYGERYKSVNYFATLHNDAGGNPFCDEFHGGLGFLNNHMYLSAYLEQSLQLVNPRTALHYMEYNKYFETQDYQNHMNYQLDGGKWTEMLTAKYFGANDPTTGEIIDGRWKSQTIPNVTPEFFAEEGIEENVTFFPVDEDAWMRKANAHLSSPYGLLRSPWNYNPSPLVTRFGSVYGINDTSIIGDSRDVVFKYHMGVRCDDYTKFFDDVKGQPLETYLMAIEDNTHGIFHFTFGGVGGPQALKSVALLVKDFGFSYSNVAALAISAQPFFKKWLAVPSATYQPVNCTTQPWQNYTLLSSIAPAEEGGPSCDFMSKYFIDEDATDGLVAYFFDIDPDTDDPVQVHLLSLTLTQRRDALHVIANMFPYDGDLAGSGAALDPLFWVAHGAMERTFQKAVFSGIFSDMKYDSSDHCSGHNSMVGKYWLKGFYFADESVNTTSQTNAQLTMILDPTSDQYRDLINFVYDTATFEWCDGNENWFSS